MPKPCSHGAEWYNCQKCHIQNTYQTTPKEIENAIKNSAIAFAIAAILGYIVPPPYGSFSIFAVAMEFLIAGAIQTTGGSKGTRSKRNLDPRSRTKTLDLELNGSAL